MKHIMQKQDVERSLSQHQQDIISDAVVNQKVGRLCDLQVAPIQTQSTINSYEIHLISGRIGFTSENNYQLSPALRLPAGSRWAGPQVTYTCSTDSFTSCQPTFENCFCAQTEYKGRPLCSHLWLSQE